MKWKIKNTVQLLNEAFSISIISFEINDIKGIQSDLYINDLMYNNYTPHIEFSDTHDVKKTTFLYMYSNSAKNYAKRQKPVFDVDVQEVFLYPICID